MKKIITILLMISTIGILSTGIAIPESGNPDTALLELHGILSLLFSICLFIHVKKHFKSFIHSFKILKR